MNPRQLIRNLEPSNSESDAGQVGIGWRLIGRGIVQQAVGHLAAWDFVQAVPARLAERATGTTVCPWAAIVLRMTGMTKASRLQFGPSGPASDDA
jgi:hypothetical protein